MISNKSLAERSEHPDAELVLLSLAGNRQAFESIVARYQSLICSIAYSATGNVGRSEDVAQETFLAAWKQLGGLREPARLRSWLCGIARNLINNTFRQQRREPLHGAKSLDDVQDATSPELPPSEEAISREEETMVWCALEQIPGLYREPMILFYRESQSVEFVARQLEISEDAVKQRLLRGRAMLRSQVAALVEGALKRSRPGRVFTLAVMAALPGVVAGSAKAASLGAAGKAGVPLAKAAFSAGAAGGMFGILGGLLGGAAGGWASWQTARYQRQRDLLRGSFIFFGVAATLYSAPFVAMNVVSRHFLQHHPLPFALALAGWILGFLALNFAWSFRLSRQFNKITAEEIAAGSALLPETRLIRGFSRLGLKWEGRQWRSRSSFLGLPLVDINFSSPDAHSVISKMTLSALLTNKGQVARGWIAFGDRAQGILFACGNVAMGGIAVGGFSAGLVAIGGLALGVVSVGGAALGGLALGGLATGGIAWGGAAIGGFCFGGLAIGWLAFGGGAFAWRAAYGGFACAHDFAMGGQAVAIHANDEMARQFIEASRFFHEGNWQMAHVIPKLSGPWFVVTVIALSSLAPALMFAVGYRRRKPVF